MFITPEIAKQHLRLIGDDGAADLALKVAAAEQAAVNYLDRAVYADQDALDAALALIPALLAADKAAAVAAEAAAQLIADGELRGLEEDYAIEKYVQARFAAGRIRRGLVINSAIQSAMLLILGDLWESREDTVIGASATRLPNGARSLLDAYRHYGA